MFSQKPYKQLAFSGSIKKPNHHSKAPTLPLITQNNRLPAKQTNRPKPRTATSSRTSSAVKIPHSELQRKGLAAKGARKKEDGVEEYKEVIEKLHLRRLERKIMERGGQLDVLSEFF